MRLLLLRHGESKHGVEKFIAQATCKGLTERGVQQAERMRGGWGQSLLTAMSFYRPR